MTSSRVDAPIPTYADVSKPARRGWLRFAISVVLHVGIGAALFALRPPKHDDIVEVEFGDARKRQKPSAPHDTPPPPPPPPVTKPDAPPQRPAAPHVPVNAPIPQAAAPVPVGGGHAFDVGMSNDGGLGGMAVPTDGGGAPINAPSASATSAPTTKEVVKTLGAPSNGDDCTEPLVKASPKSVPQPAYPEQARADGISGKVRVEVTIDATGAVVGARVVSGLGHGLDEAALGAARSAKFAPATKCGRPTQTTFVIGMRFSQ